MNEHAPIKRKRAWKGSTLHDLNLEKGSKEQEEIRHSVCEEPNAREHGTQKDVQEHCYTRTKESYYGMWFEHAAFWSGVSRATIAPRSQAFLGNLRL